jgi:hypothetical protein
MLKRLKTAALIRHFHPVKKRAKIKTFNAYTLPKVYQLGGITRHTWHIV